MKTTKALGIVGTLVLALAAVACGGDDGEGGGGGEPANGAAPAASPSAESGGFGFEVSANAIVRRTSGGRIDVRVMGASNVSYDLEGLPAGIVEKEHSDTSITLAFGGGEPAFGEHSIKVRAKSGSEMREQTLSLIVADDAGTLDVTFGQKGLASGGASQMPTSIAIDASGRTVVAGAETSTGKAFVSRFLANGAPDSELDGDGTASFMFDEALPAEGAMSVALGADGSIVIGGFASTNGGKALACVAKLDAKGAPAAGFGKDGRTCLKTALLPEHTMIGGIALNADGSVVATGMTQGMSGTEVFLAKLDSAGALDESFGSGGVARFSSYAAMGQSIVLDREGRILVAGTMMDQVSMKMAGFVMRLEKDGKADPWFGSGGMKVVARGAQGSMGLGIALGPNGESFVAGQEDKLGNIIALDPSKGEPLASFGTNGAVTFPEGDEAMLQHLAWDDGKLVAVGGSKTGATASVMVRRVSASGAVDGTFGQAGSMTLPGDSARAIAIAPQSRAVVLVSTPTGYTVARAWR